MKSKNIQWHCILQKRNWLKYSCIGFNLEELLSKNKMTCVSFDRIFFTLKCCWFFFQYCQFLRAKDDVYQYKLRFPAIIDSNYPNTSNDFFLTCNVWYLHTCTKHQRILFINSEKLQKLRHEMAFNEIRFMYSITIKKNHLKMFSLRSDFGLWSFDTVLLESG